MYLEMQILIYLKSIKLYIQKIFRKEIHYFVNKEQIVKEIKKVDIENILDDVTVEKLSNVNKEIKGFMLHFLCFYR